MSDFSRNKLIEGGLPAPKIDLKPNFVSPDPGMGGGQGGYAMYLGRLSPEKGVPVLVDAWKDIGATLPLKIVGTGPLSTLIESAAADNSSIECLGWRDDCEVSQLRADAACLVMPSVNYEGFPKTIVESLAQGTPVVASRLGAMAEIIEDGSTGVLFRPGDANDLAQKIIDVWKQPAGLAAMRRRARDAYERSYTAETNYDMLMSIYNRAIAHRATASSTDQEVRVSTLGSTAHVNNAVEVDESWTTSL